jgi:hypothetical protein
MQSHQTSMLESVRLASRERPRLSLCGDPFPRHFGVALSEAPPRTYSARRGTSIAGRVYPAIYCNVGFPTHRSESHLWG